MAVIGATTFAQLLVGVLVNIDDYKYYQQALTFQRLDFDAKLGMHSPR